MVTPKRKRAPAPVVATVAAAESLVLRLTFFLRPTLLSGQFPPVTAADLEREEDLGIEFPEVLVELARHGRGPVDVPDGATPDDIAGLLHDEIQAVFESPAATDGEVTIGDGVLSWSPDGAPPWIEDPDPNDSDPIFIFPVLMGGVEEFVIEGVNGNGSQYECRWRWFVVGRFVQP